MTDSAAERQGAAMAGTIDAMIAFAESEEDYVLAAKLAAVHAHLIDRYDLK